MLRLEEVPDAIPVPPEWHSSLTPKEQEVTSALLRGWDNELIANELTCSTATVKKHMQHVFDKLGLPSRTALAVRAAVLWMARRRGGS